MRVRDMVIVAVALLFCVIAWSQDGAVSFHRAFRILIDDPEVQMNMMPKPLVIDPEGLGKPVLLVSTADAYLMRYDTHRVSYAVRNHFTTLIEGASMAFDRSLVAIGAGNLRFDSPVKTVAVLTAGYMLYAIDLQDGHLQARWKVQVAKMSEWVDLYHAAITVVPERSDAEDTGMIIVAVRVVDRHGAGLTLFAAYNGADGALRWRDYSDGDNEGDDVLREANMSTTEPVAAAANLLPFTQHDLAAGQVGNGGIYQGGAQAAQGTRRPYAQPWTTYRDAVITALPHHYAHPWDERLQPHVFYPAKSRRKARTVRPGWRTTLLHNRRVLRVPGEDFGLLGEKLNLWRGRRDEADALAAGPTGRRPHDGRRHRSDGRVAPPRRLPANVLVYHGRHGMEVIHLFTGNSITSVLPLKATHTYYHDINDDNYIEAIGTQIGPRTTMHGRYDVDTVFECLGAIHTGVPVAEDMLYNATICDTQGLFGNLNLLHRLLDGDVRGEDGVGPGLGGLARFGSRTVATATTRAVMPLVVQTHTAQGRDLVQVERFAVYMIDTGLVTCLDPSRQRVLWRTQADAITSAPEPAAVPLHRRGRTTEDDEGEVKNFPHLTSYSLHQRRVEHDVDFVGGASRMYDHTDPYVLAVRERFMTAIHTRSGRVAHSVMLDEPPVAPALVVDFNGDGTNDVIIVSQRHIYGFTGGAQVSSATMAALMVLMLSLLVLLFIAREVTVRATGEDEYTLPSTQKDLAKRRKGLRRATD